MSEMIHPPIAPGFGPNLSLERAFAQEAYLLLADNGRDSVEQVNGLDVMTSKTDWVDMVAEETDKSAALRLRNLPVFRIMSSGMEELKPSFDYKVITLEYGELDMAEEFEDDDDADNDDDGFDWQPYVIVVINDEKVEEVDILDAKTGSALSPMDLVTAYAYLMQVSQEMRHERFEALLWDDIGGPEYEEPPQPKTSYGEFDSTEFMLVSQCTECGTVNQACSHNPYTLN